MVVSPDVPLLRFTRIKGEKCFPFLTPLKVRRGDRVRIRLATAIMEAHPIHLHGHRFLVAAEDGNNLPRKQRRRLSTILVASGQTRDVEFTADNPGLWPFYCHIPHHNADNFTVPKHMETVVQVHTERAVIPSRCRGGIVALQTRVNVPAACPFHKPVRDRPVVNLAGQTVFTTDDYEITGVIQLLLAIGENNARDRDV
ncbi:MAG: multicopper oxidase domain-containing protein, partial [Peptococcaceae bacterium]|nr:multicopper oxidase domain-containing protein [Peptococcaceae bacterium]